MIIDEKILVKIDRSNIEYYTNAGFSVKLKDIISINPNILQRGSNKKINVKCDKCGKHRELKYQKYMDNFENGGIYLCSKCCIEKIHNAHMKRYGKFFNNRDKCKITNFEKYGCENVSGSQIIKDKKTETNLKNWGVENVFQSDDIKNISMKTKMDRYDDEHFTNREKSKQTCINNNGVEWPTQSDDILQKRNSNNKEKYGFEHYTQTENYKKNVVETNMKEYGTVWYMSSKDFKDKSKITNLERYGVEYNMQNESIYMKAQISGQKAHIHDKTGLFYRGSYEKDFLDMCVKNNIKVEQGKRFSYEFNGKKKYYFSDYFLLNRNLVIEIKSSYYYKKYYDINLAKMNSAIKEGYNFIFIIDKNYQEFNNYI